MSTGPLEAEVNSLLDELIDEAERLDEIAPHRTRALASIHG